MGDASRFLRGALAALVVLAAGGCSAGPPPNLVLITLDTTRADRLGPYGHAAARTPVLDAFAEEAVVYERAYATSSWTLPSHASLFTGLLPMQHGAQAAAGGESEALGYGVRALSDDFTTLAETLRERGYRTAAVVGGPAMRGDLGLAQGFEFYLDELNGPFAKLVGKRAQQVAEQAIELVERFGSEPFFLFVNFYDPHAPYRPPAPHARGLPEIDEPSFVPRLIARIGEPRGAAPALDEAERAGLAAMLAGYDGEIAYTDLHLGRLIAALRNAPRGDDTLVAVTSDHGESFGEHFYVSHGAHIYEDNVRVPLLIRYPGGAGAGTRLAEPVENRALFATFRQAAGLGPGPHDVPRLDRRGDPIVTEVRRSDNNVRMFGPRFDRDLRAIYAPPFKLIEDTTGRVELFDLDADPGELLDLSAEDPERAAALRSRLEAIADARPPLYDPEARAELSEETERALRALGYLP